jgi:D-arabinose 1-dehydrogenase-like Zn-dependent alcohol dehydrogenase
MASETLDITGCLPHHCHHPFIRHDPHFHPTEGLPLEAAAGVPITYGTSHLALVQRAQLQKGQTLLVLGASGGVGTTAVQVRVRGRGNDWCRGVKNELVRCAGGGGR